MILRERFIPGLAIATYIVGDKTTGRAAVVDPTRDVQPIVGMAAWNAAGFGADSPTTEAVVQTAE